MKIAVIGTGVSGLVAAYVLQRSHEVVVYEANDYIGGHTHTVDVDVQGVQLPVDTGFIVHNDRMYPNFKRLLELLDVERRPTSMSFSIKCERSGLEFGSYSWLSFFAQPSNLLRPSYYRMLLDILRFFKRAQALAERGESDLLLGQFLDEGRYSPLFRESFILPMMSAIWSSPMTTVERFPAGHFMRFFENHGLLNLKDRPTWYSIVGGSRRYVDEILKAFKGQVRLNMPVQSIRREEDGVLVRSPQGEEKFDHAVLAMHSDQALAMLEDASPAEQEILESIRYGTNDVVLHSDVSLLPKRRAAWASWNYHLLPDQPAHPVVTYNMNILQGLKAPETLCITLNRTEAVDPDKILGRFSYDHPIFDRQALDAQERWPQISGVNRTHFCGAYWGYGFHEDGVRSALNVCEAFGESL
jgi:predicted NAD/FAD-binding protein